MYDLPPNKRWRSHKIGAPIGEVGKGGAVALTRGEPQLADHSGIVAAGGGADIDKPGKVHLRDGFWKYSCGSAGREFDLTGGG